MGLGEDPVLPQLARGEAGADGESEPSGADRATAVDAALVDEEVVVGGVGPSLGAVVQPGGESFADGCGQREGAPVGADPAVDDVGEL